PLSVLVVAGIVIIIVITAAMVSTPWVQFTMASPLVVRCAPLTVLSLARGVTTRPTDSTGRPRTRAARNVSLDHLPGTALPEEGPWSGKPYVRVKDANGIVTIWRKDADGTFCETQAVAVRPGGRKFVNGLPHGRKPGEADLHPVG